MAIPKLNWQGQQDSSIFDDGNNSSTLQQPPPIESTGNTGNEYGLSAHQQLSSQNKKETEPESRNLGSPLRYLQQESDGNQRP